MSTPVATRPALTSAATALQILLRGLRPLGVETVAVRDAAGRFAADDVQSRLTLPGCDNSAMDGYAVRAADCLQAPTRLPVRGDSRAGDAVSELAPGAAMRIATGAPLPRGADSVVRLEDCDDLAEVVSIRIVPSSGDHVRRTGEDTHPGDLLIAAGRRLRAVDIGACAAAGVTAVRVHRRPRVALLAGGDELVPAGTPPLPHQVIDSNAPMLTAAVAEAGGTPVDLGRVHDDPDALRLALLRAAGCDLVITTAGVSVGARDHVRSVVESIGCIDVWGIAIRPGKPVLLGAVQETPMLGLPGNPVSSAVTFELFARPAIRALQGALAPERRRIGVRLQERVCTPRALDTFLRVTLETAGDPIPAARLSGGQGSAMLRPLAAADALAIVPAGVDDCPAGTVLAAIEVT